MKQSIKEILNEGTARICMITAADLKEVIRDTVLETKRELEAEIAKNKSDVLLTTDEVAERLSVSRTTLWKWEKKNYLGPIEVGGKRRYKLSDINEILRK